MTGEIAQLSSIEGVSYRNINELNEKMRRFGAAGLQQVHLVADFDRTLTVNHPGTNVDVTSWGILRDHLPQAAQDECSELFTIYRAKEIDGTMTYEDAVTWWSTVLDIYAAHHLDMAEVERDFLHRASIRPVAKELFDYCKAMSIPSIVLSAGIKEVIDLWGRAYGIDPTLVLATELITDDAQQITGWKTDTLVHVLNKVEIQHPELSTIREARPYTFLVGDGLGDASMTEGEADVIRLRIFDPRPDESYDIDAERTKTFKYFDAMIENGSLAPLLDLLRSIAQK